MLLKPLNNNTLLQEGGVIGHMRHPYEIFSPEIFIKFINDLLAGKYELWEKVDGAALTIGLDKFDNVVYVRSKKAAPSIDIEAKFPPEHPGSDAFRSGFQAIKKAIKQLSKEQIKKYHLNEYFLNIEIIYGFVPNLIPYSETSNYIVFHHYANPVKDYELVDINSNLLNDLAKELGHIEVISKVINYIGTPMDADRIIENRTSAWEFRGPIKFDKSEVTDKLSKILDYWKKLPEIQQLAKEHDKEARFELMRIIAQKIGSKILIRMVSKLARTEKKFPGHPRIEGLVIKYKDGLNRETLLKITGDFRELNQQLWAPLREELDPIIKDFNMFMLNDIFGISKVSKFTAKTMDKYSTTDELFQARSMVNINSTDIKLSSIDKKIDTTIAQLQQLWLKYKGSLSIKAEDIKRALLINGYKLKKLKHNINKARTIGEAFKAYMVNIFGWGKV